ncbi:neuronal PAS domain-containing protein 4-like [Cheilinus undulatus]|uniref:neuronal PAS domain-containing protein 4-like n=1 Tax=Cheilinus undulatus TaxID=241271 RepID=UPI001BD25F17|nr:neuronal PAS domain-containing protein 4-like [Cheilinus undulatus]
MKNWSSSCRRHLISPCTSHPQPGDPSSSSCRRFRSTKGASKARRDHINHEIRNMRALLPISRDDQERLSYLHSMAAICTFIRKSVLLQGLSAGAERSNCSLPYEAFLPALHGFVLVTTAQGRLVYVSENVAEYLGFSMLDVLQGDTFYDMVECSDVDAVKLNLDTEHNSSPERSFVCHMQTSRAFKLQHGGCCSMLVRGRFRAFPHPSSVCPPSSSQPLFVALCTPTVNRLQGSDSRFCLSFSSVHRADMSFTQLSDGVSFFLGHSAQELIGRSWYGLVHPEDLAVCAESHRGLMHADEGSQVEMVLRLQGKDLSWTWIYIQANKISEIQGVSCTNFIISQTEARFLQRKISSEAFKPSAPRHFTAQQTPQTPTQSESGAKCFKRRRTSDSQSEEQSAKARRESDRDVYFVACSSSPGDSSPALCGDSLAVFTPPYSPASSSCSALQPDELSRDLLVDVHGYTDQCSFPEAALTCHRSPSVPTPEQTFEQADFVAFTPLPSSSSPQYGFQSPASDVRLVPDSLSLSDMSEGSVDCALHQEDFSLLQQPAGGGIVPSHHVPEPLNSSLLTPDQSPSSSECDYSNREQAEISILAQQISSLASSFDTYNSLNPLQNPTPPTALCDWPLHPLLPAPLPLKHEQILDDCMLESILKDLDMVTMNSSTSSLGLPSHSHQLEEELLHRGTFMDPFSLQLGRHGEYTELHQLNHYMQRVLQQDALAEENLY